MIFFALKTLIFTKSLFILIYREDQPDESSPSNGSVGRLKLTSEMKDKLEAVTGGGSRKDSVKSTTSKKSEDSMEVGGDPVGKLEEKKKLLIEQKLGAGKKLILRIIAP